MKRIKTVLLLFICSLAFAPPNSFAKEKKVDYIATKEKAGQVDYAIVPTKYRYNNAATVLNSNASAIGETIAQIFCLVTETATVELKAKTTVEPGGDRYRQVAALSILFSKYDDFLAYKIPDLHIDPGLFDNRHYLNI